MYIRAHTENAGLRCHIRIRGNAHAEDLHHVELDDSGTGFTADREGLEELHAKVGAYLATLDATEPGVAWPEQSGVAS